MNLMIRNIDKKGKKKEQLKFKKTKTALEIQDSS